MCSLSFSLRTTHAHRRTPGARLFKTFQRNGTRSIFSPRTSTDCSRCFCRQRPCPVQRREKELLMTSERHSRYSCLLKKSMSDILGTRTTTIRLCREISTTLRGHAGCVILIKIHPRIRQSFRQTRCRAILAEYQKHTRRSAMSHRCQA